MLLQTCCSNNNMASCSKSEGALDWKFSAFIQLVLAYSVCAFNQLDLQNDKQQYNVWIGKPYDAHEFFFSSQLKSRKEAEALCESRKSALINFEDHIPELYLFVETVGLDKYLYFGNGTFHVGLVKRLRSTFWAWTISNLPLQEKDSLFAEGLNDDRPIGNLECAYSTLNRQWFYEDCISSVERLFICQRCKTVLNSCADHPCLNQGTCAQGVGQKGFICLCPKGLTGALCETDIQECSLNQPCKNKGICIEQFGSYACVCDENHQGKNCEQRRVITTPALKLQRIQLTTKSDDEESCQFWFLVAVALLILVSLATPIGIWLYCSLLDKSKSTGSKRIYRPISKSIIKVIQKKITGKQKFSPTGLLLPSKL